MFLFDFLLKLFERHKILNPQNTQEKTFWTHEIPTWKHLGPMKYPRPEYPQEKILDPRNTHEKSFGPTKYPQDKNLDPRNTHEKIF